jgi:Crp-like helix-turn-helix domain
MHKGTRLSLTARHQDIPELVGASRPRVTECLIRFERKHLIVRDGHQLIVSRERLEDFLARTAAASTRLGRERSYSGLL